MEKKLLTVTEAAEKYKIHPEKIRRAIRNGELKVEKDGKRKINEDEVKGIFLNKPQEDNTEKITKKMLYLGITGYKIKPGTVMNFEEVKDFTENASIRGIRYQKDNYDDLYIITDVRQSKQKPYPDRWIIEKNMLEYCGEGKKRNQTFTAGNLRLRNRIYDKGPVQVIAKIGVDHYVYWGQFKVISHYQVMQGIPPEAYEVIRFSLIPILKEKPFEKPLYIEGIDTIDDKKMEKEIISKLNRIQNKLHKNQTNTQTFVRSRKLVELLKKLYNYRCQLCNPDNPILPILMKNGAQYVEVHHIKGFNEVSHLIDNDNQESGEFLIDSVNNVIVCCAQHHKFLHYYHSPLHYIKEEQSFVSEDGTLKFPVYLKKPGHNLGEE
ncbi:helix-turn-helix domain-containing protein [Bacillus tropicus]|uniref:helix-turn-helix domain-containing protein n=1 Tax=Bacillus tropicus TaxID=2026188 RepID=UPI00307E4573